MVPERRQPRHNFSKPGELQEFPRNVEEVHKWEFADVTEEHIPGIRRLFRRFLIPGESKTGRVNMDSYHVFHEDINEFPNDWEDKEQVERFEVSLSRFYLSKNIKIKASRTNEELKVERKSKVCIRDGQIVGVYSRLTDDPYTTASDRRRAAEGSLVMEYGHVMLVDPDYRNQQVGTALAGVVIDDAFKAMEERVREKQDKSVTKFQFTSCIDKKGDWGAIVDFAERLGFEAGRRIEDRYSYLNKRNETISGQRYILEYERWRNLRQGIYARIRRHWNLPDGTKVA